MQQKGEKALMPNTKQTEPQPSNDAPDNATVQALRQLEDDQEYLDRLGAMAVERRSEIDVFDVLRLGGSELFHSNFLFWLLDPGGSHGMGEDFLRRFLRKSEAKTSLRAGRHASSAVHREREITLNGGTGRLDIFILNENAKFLCAIENKVWSDEGENQLAFYREALDAHWPDYTIHRVFLTPEGHEPEKAEEREHWNRMSYKDILRLVERTIRQQGNSVHADVVAMLRQYAVTLRRNIVPEVSNDAHSTGPQDLPEAQGGHRPDNRAPGPLRTQLPDRRVLDGKGGGPRASRVGRSHLQPPLCSLYTRTGWCQYDAENQGWTDGLGIYATVFQVHVTEPQCWVVPLPESGAVTRLSRREIYDRLRR